MSSEASNVPQWPGWKTNRLIGRGSYGAVYEIEREVFGDVEKAALKVISIPQNESDIDEFYMEGYSEADVTETFRDHLKSIVAEYSLMRKLNGCSNIVHSEDIRYVEHEDGIGWDIFIKMELLTPLMKALPLAVPEDTVVKIAKDMCVALELCRKHGIIHRDIKPQNIFVSPHGDYKLGDFGIAKTVEKTMGGTKIGTYKFMAPEVYNNQPYGMTADIYSLGLVLYWLLNERRVPFLPLPPVKSTVAMEETARERRFRGEALPPPAHGSEKLKQIVLKACAFDPKERYCSAAEMMKAIDGEILLCHDESQLREKDIVKTIASEELVRKCELCGSELLPGRIFCLKCADSNLKSNAENCSVMSNIVNHEQNMSSKSDHSELPQRKREKDKVFIERKIKSIQWGGSSVCINCGASLLPNRSFCVKCGAHLGELAVAQKECCESMALVDEVEMRFQRLQQRRKSKGINR